MFNELDNILYYIVGVLERRTTMWAGYVCGPEGRILREIKNSVETRQKKKEKMTGKPRAPGNKE